MSKLSDDRGNAVGLGDTVRSVETGWEGVVQEVERMGEELFLRCHGCDFLAATVFDRKVVSADDTRWFWPGDVVVIEKGGAK